MTVAWTRVLTVKMERKGQISDSLEMKTTGLADGLHWGEW